MASRINLRDFLTRKQQQQAKNHGYIEVKGSAGGLYKIHLNEPSENIEVWDDGYGAYAYTFCAHIEGPPYQAFTTMEDRIKTQQRWEEENFIVQYLTIKYNEQAFLDVANEV